MTQGIDIDSRQIVLMIAEGEKKRLRKSKNQKKGFFKRIFKGGK